MEAAGVAAVVTGKNSAFLVDLTAEGIASPFGEDLEAFGLRVIPPNLLAHRVGDWLLVQARAQDFRRNGATLAPVQPAVRSPAQAVHDRMSVFQTKTGQHHLRVT